jgi:hypothetical protein
MPHTAATARARARPTLVALWPKYGKRELEADLVAGLANLLVAPANSTSGSAYDRAGCARRGIASAHIKKFVRLVNKLLTRLFQSAFAVDQKDRTSSCK